MTKCLRVGRIYRTMDGREVRIIGLNAYWDFVGEIEIEKRAVRYNSSGLPLNPKTHKPEKDNPLTLILE